MIDLLLRTIVPQIDELEVTVHLGDTYVGPVTAEALNPFFEAWLSMIQKGQFWVRVDIGSFGRYFEAPDLTTCEATENTYFYDGDQVTGGNLYIHFPSGTVIPDLVVVVADESGFSLNAPAVFDGTVFNPGIKTAIRIRQEADNRNVGAMRFVDQKVSLYNTAGNLDSLIQAPVPGTVGNLFFFDNSDSSILPFYTGIVRGDESSIEDFLLDLLDIRRDEDAAVPSLTFGTTGFPNAPDSTIGKTVPDGYGKLKGIKAFCIDPTVSPTEWQVAQRYTNITAAYYKDDDSWIPANFVESNPAAGRFTTTDGLNSSGNVRQIRVDAELRAPVNPGEIIEDLNSRYLGLSFTSDNYDLAEWNAEKAKLADVSLYMENPDSLYSWIEKLQNGSDLQFIYLIDGEGKRSLRVADPLREAIARYTFYYNKNDILRFTRNYSEVAAKNTVEYDYDYRTQIAKEYTDDTRESYVRRQYGTDREITSRSLLVTEPDARNRAESFMDDYTDVRATSSFRLHITSLSLLTIKLFDVIFFDYERPAEAVQVTGGDVADIIVDRSGPDSYTVDKGPDTFTIGTAELTEVIVVPGRRYWGTIRGLVTRIEYDPASLSYEITIRELPLEISIAGGIPGAFRS